MSLIVVPITAGPDIIGVPEGYKIGQEADSDYPIDHVVSGNSSWYDGSKNQSSNLNALTTDDSIPSSITESKWTSSKANEWIDFAYGDEDSVEMVIGINNAQSDSYARLGELITRNGGEIVNTVSMKNEIEASVADIPLVAVSDFLEAVKAADLSRYIEPNLKFQATFIPNDPYWMMQWGPEKIEADYAWNTTIGDSSVLVAVIDTGIDWNHPDLVANYVALGYDWVNNDTDPMDDYGHGTHCAGIIAAELNNSVGIAGVAQVKVMAEKGLNAWGWGSEDDLANAIIHAVDAGADILSNSWGGYGESSLIHEAVEYAYDNGVLVIASAGNSASDVKLYPAAYDEVIAVTATDESDYPAYFTNFGSWVEVAAPGVDIFSTVWDDLYDYKSGTSMAAPHVAGVAALVLSQFPNVTRDWVRQWLRYTADDLGDPGFDVYYGYGRINARRAIEAAPPEHDLVITNLNTPPYLEPNSSGTVNTIVLNFGAEDESNVTVQLLVNGSLVDSKLISFLATGTSATVACSWNSTVEGIYNVTSYVVAVPNETLIENNVVSTYIYVGFPVKVFVLDSAGTDLPYVISTWQILNTNWHVFGDTMIYVDYTTLNIDDITYSDLVAADADVLIISCAYMWEFSDSEIDAISRYTLEGHGLIATAGTLYDGVPNNNKLAQLFGLNETTIWSATQTDLLHIENVTHPVFANVPDPFIFRYVTTAVPSDSQWDLNELFGGTYMALGNFLESAIVVNRGLVYISPWLETIPPYYHFHLQLLYNAITWTRYQKPMHELVVSLDCPPGLKPGESALLNATVSNVGLSNETNVELQLLIDGSEANSTTIPQLMNGTSCTIDYLWTPTVEKTYNVTAYASPVPSEDNTLNNVRSKMVTVSSLLVALFKNWDPWGYPANEEALSLYNINYIVFDSNDFGVVDLNSFSKVVIASDQDQTFYNALDTYKWWFEDYASSGGVLEIHAADWGWNGGQWVGTLPGDLQWVSYSSDAVTIVDHTHPIVTTPNYITDAELDYWHSSVHGYFSTYPADSRIVITEDFTGHPANLEFNYGAGVIVASSQTLEWAYRNSDSPILENILLYAPIKYQHELSVSLDVPSFLEPGDSSLLNATVYNHGLSNEIDVELFLLINGTVVNNITIPEMVNGTSYMIDHSWTPTVEGIYNVTAYAPSVPDENVTANNVMSRMVYVRYVAVALISDYSELLAVTDILDSMGIGYDIYNDNRFYLYTEDLSLLLDYSTVIFYTDYRHITSAEHSTLESYLNLGGNLLITGFDCLVGDYLLADLVRSSSYGDNVGEPDLYVVNATHPIMNGPYGSFPPGYHISGLFSDCDAVEADTARMAVTVAELADGYDRIIATDGLPGKVVFWNGKGDYDWTWNTDCEAMFKNTIVWFTARYEHDLAVSLDTPTSLEPSNSSLLSATVHNLGLNNETDVELFLQINGSIVDNTTIPQLLTSSSYTINYLWSPPIEGTYNITAYAPPVLNESIVENNVLSKMVRVYTVEYPGIMIVPAITMNQTVTPGSNFTVSIYTDYTGADITAYQFNLSYNPAVLNGISVTNGDIIDFGLHFFMPGTFDNVAGTLSLTGAFFFTAGDVAPGPGTLANVTFTVVGTGVSEITLGQKTQLIGWNSTAIPPVEYSIINAATMPDHIGHGYFSNTPQPPQAITATINIKPNTLNLKSERKWITCYIEPPEGYNVSDIDVSTVILNDFLPVSLLDVPAPEPVPTEIGDYDSDGIPDLMVKYNRTELTAHIYHISGITYGNVTLTITGQLADGTPFEGSYNIKVMFGGDADLSGYVEIFDFFIWRENWGKTPDQCPPSVYPDFDDNGLVDMHDFFIWRENFGATVPSPP
ncbi:MAG: S8 family serine peptidase [Candidatus Bathyarchaeota archaeon]|jgi:thermitase